MTWVKQFLFWLRLYRWMFPRWFLGRIWRYYKGRYYCRVWHSPVICHLGGYGGSDHLLRKQKEYKGVYCVSCGNHWEESGPYRAFGGHWWSRARPRVMKHVRPRGSFAARKRPAP